MKKAFTLIELLVVIAIIAILAAILFPVFAQAKQAAKAAVALSNTKQTGLATIIYTTDNDDVFPLAAVLRPPNGSTAGTLGIGLQYPYPYNNGEVVSSASPTTIWQQAARMNMAQAFIGNSIVPYTKSLDIEAISGLKEFTRSGDSYPGSPFAPAADSSLSYNGLLHHFSTTGVASPSIAIMWWCGSGGDNDHGTTSANPSLNCGNTIDDCNFNSGGVASPVPAYSGTAAGLLFLNADPSNYYPVYSTHKAPFVRTDTSAKAMPQGSATYPSYLNNAGAFIDPLQSYVPDGTVIGGNTYTSTFANSVCSGPTTVDGSWTTAAAHLTTDYPCYFRPDRTK